MPRRREPSKILDPKKVERFLSMSQKELNRTIAFISIREYLFDHPFSALDVKGCRVFNDDYRRFVLTLTEPGQACEGMAVDELAQVTGVRDDVLEVWLLRR
jgi:hypothetical protein